jgi:hypothetical protein
VSLLLPLLLLGITACSVIPLAGYKGGWAHFHKDGLQSNILRDLGLSPFNHTITVGYVYVRAPGPHVFCSCPLCIHSAIAGCGSTGSEQA